MQTCNRYQADGTLCGRPTVYADGWCRKPDCGGFRSAAAPQNHTGPEGEAPHLQFGGEPAPLSPEEAYEISISRAAREQFIAVHGGSDANAEAELRSMLEDLLHERRWRRTPNGSWALSMWGYTVKLSPEASTMRGYGTVHAERSYSQVKAGVPRRLGAARQQRRRERNAVPSGPELDEAGVRNLDTSTIQVDSDALQGLRRWIRTQEHVRQQARAVFPDLLAHDLQEGVVTRAEDGAWRVIGDELEWLVRADGQRLLRSNHLQDPGNRIAAVPADGATEDRTQG